MRASACSECANGGSLVLRRPRSLRVMVRPPSGVEAHRCYRWLAVRPGIVDHTLPTHARQRLPEGAPERRTCLWIQSQRRRAEMDRHDLAPRTELDGRDVPPRHRLPFTACVLRQNLPPFLRFTSERRPVDNESENQYQKGTGPRL